MQQQTIVCMVTKGSVFYTFSRKDGRKYDEKDANINKCIKVVNTVVYVITLFVFISLKPAAKVKTVKIQHF